jgi:hypothetical protein
LDHQHGHDLALRLVDGLAARVDDDCLIEFPHEEVAEASATTENPNTRAAFFHVCRRFFTWREHERVDEVAAIEPMHRAVYMRGLGKDFEKPSIKQHLAAIRMPCDGLFVRRMLQSTPRARNFIAVFS